MRARVLALPLLSVLASALVLTAYVRAGGGDYVPQTPADPCRERPGGTGTPRDLEALAERLVLTALDETACARGITRERLVLELPGNRERLAPSLKRGLRAAVTRLERAGRLPKTSALLPEVLDQTDPPGAVRTLIEAIPDDTVDDFLPSGPLLRRVVDRLDVRALVQDPEGADLEKRLRDAVIAAAREEIEDRLRDRLPGGLRDLLGG